MNSSFPPCTNPSASFLNTLVGASRRLALFLIVAAFGLQPALARIAVEAEDQELDRIALDRLSQRAEREPQSNLIAAPSRTAFGAENAAQNNSPFDGGGNLDAAFTAGISEGTAPVYALATQPDGKFLVGGNFARVNGATRGSIERFNADGTPDASFNPNGAGANGSVYVINVLPTGKILISGTFSTYNSQIAPTIARLNSDGTLDTSFVVPGTGANSSIQDTIVQPDGKILISGNFTSFSGTARNRVARLNADGTLDTTFNPDVAGFVEELVLQPDGKIIIGGIFTAVGGLLRNSIARLNPNGSVDSTFTVGGGIGRNDGSNGDVYAAELQPDGKILVGGDFDSYNGVQRQNFVRLNADGTLDTAFSPLAGGGTRSVEHFAIQPDGKIVMVGEFALRAIVMRLNSDGTADPTFQLRSADDLGYTVALQANGKILVGGFFTVYGSEERQGLIRLDANGLPDSVAPAFSSNPIVRAIAQQPDGKIVVGGQFRRVNGVPRRNIARLNPDGSLDATFDPGSGTDNFNQPSMWAVAVQPDGKILIGGFFTSVNQVERNNVARLNSDGSLDTSFAYSNAISTVRDIEVQPDGKILLGGYFYNVAQDVYNGIVRLNPNGSPDQTFNSVGANNTVTEIEPLADGKFLIGGSFTFYGTVSRSRIARINANGTLDTAFNSGLGANSTVYDFAVLPNGQIYVGGFFSSFNGAPNTNDVVRLNPNGSLDASFSTGTTGFNGGVYTLSLQPDGKLLVGGNFISYNGTAVNQLALLNPDGSLDASFTSPLTGSTNSNGVFNFIYRLLRQPDGKVLVGGFFETPRNALLRINPTVAIRRAPFDFDGDGRTDFSVFRPNGGNWFVQQSTAGFVAAQFGAPSDKLAPADYDGDGKTDFAVYRPDQGVWYLLKSREGFAAVQFGAAEDKPVPADYDGDGRADIAVYRPSESAWYRLNSSNDQVVAAQLGVAGDFPIPGDYDGDGKADIAVWRAETGTWFVRASNDGFLSLQLGLPEDKPVVGDYNGDGKTDFAVWRPSNGTWYVSSGQSGFNAFQFGVSGDVPVPGDYDGDGKTDYAVFRPTSGIWYLQNSVNGFAATQFGVATDKLVPASFGR